MDSRVVRCRTGRAPVQAAPRAGFRRRAPKPGGDTGQRKCLPGWAGSSRLNTTPHQWLGVTTVIKCGNARGSRAAAHIVAGWDYRLKRGLAALHRTTRATRRVHPRAKGLGCALELTASPGLGRRAPCPRQCPDPPSSHAAIPSGPAPLRLARPGRASTSVHPASAGGTGVTRCLARQRHPDPRHCGRRPLFQKH